MMREPWFWRSRSLTARAITAGLSPFATLYDFAQRARWRMARPEPPPAPVICVGNATLGGVGKTPFAIRLCELLEAEGAKPHFLLRGYGGREKGPLQVDPEKHAADDVGDEALLLAKHAPCWIAANRSAGVEAAARNGAELVIMDDGFQNPTVEKTFSILLIDADDPEGNGRIFPAGPLREPVKRAQARAQATMFVGRARESAQKAADAFGSPFAAWLEVRDAPSPQKVVAFSGIGRPEKFFASLRGAGFNVAETVSFPDHHPFTIQNLTALKHRAKKREAALITTEKDFVRVPPEKREEVLVLPVAMRINDPALLTSAILTTIERHQQDRAE